MNQIMITTFLGLMVFTQASADFGGIPLDKGALRKLYNHTVGNLPLQAIFGVGVDGTIEGGIRSTPRVLGKVSPIALSMSGLSKNTKNPKFEFGANLMDTISGVIYGDKDGIKWSTRARVPIKIPKINTNAIVIGLEGHQMQPDELTIGIAINVSSSYNCRRPATYDEEDTVIYDVKTLVPDKDANGFTFKFSVRGKSNAHIQLTSQVSDSPVKIRVVLGALDNTYSAVRRIPNKDSDVHDFGPHILSDEELRSFTLKVEGVHVKIYNSTDDLIMNFQDPSVPSMKYMSFGAYEDVVTEWVFDCRVSTMNVSPSNCTTLETSKSKFTPKFDLKRWSNKDATGITFKFFARGPENAHIELTPRPYNSPVKIQIDLGADHNNYAAVRRIPNKNNDVHYDEVPHILSDKESRPFTLKLDGKRLTVYNSTNDLIMNFEDPWVASMKYISFSARDGVTIYWDFDCTY